jgi:hypothetical protein
MRVRSIPTVSSLGDTFDVAAPIVDEEAVLELLFLTHDRDFPPCERCVPTLDREDLARDRVDREANCFFR